MLSKKEFVNKMNQWKSIADDTMDVNRALRKLSPDFGGFYLCRSEEWGVDLLKVAMKDKGRYSHIDFFIYELDWGTKYHEGSYSVDGKNISLATVEDLWEELNRCRKEKKKDGKPKHCDCSGECNEGN